MARFIQRAVSGRCSQICSPGSEVEIGLNSPQISTGALGLKSNMSRWLGPPKRFKRITDRAGDGRAPGFYCSRAYSKRGMVSPENRDSAPTRSSSRRGTPSQVWLARPRIRNISRTPRHDPTAFPTSSVILFAGVPLPVEVLRPARSSGGPTVETKTPQWISAIIDRIDLCQPLFPQSNTVRLRRP